MKKIVFTNILVFFALIAIIEIFFGYWFDKNNFGILMRKHRMQTSYYEVKFNDKIYKHVYKRNFYGFRGEEVEPKNQEIIFIGGSTGNQRFTPEEYTIVGKINSDLENRGINKKIYNASMDGKSTFGIINDFEFWFPKLKDFKPKLFIFYIGLNDKFYRGNCQLNNSEKFDGNDCQISFDLKNRIIDYIKNNSITYYLAKKVKYKYIKTESKIRYDFFGYAKKDILYKDYHYINYEEAKKIHYSVKKTQDEIFIENELKKRLIRLSQYVNKYNASAIYITQVQHDGLGNRNLFFANEAVKKFCRNNGYDLIPLDEIANMEINDFYDPWHTTLKGTDRVKSYLAPKIIQKIKKIYVNN